MAIPPALSNRLRTTLLHCGPFTSDQTLQAVFADARIHQWKADLPEATSDAERVRLTVEYLSDKCTPAGRFNPPCPQ